jgi:hypothetical protein
LSSWRNDLLKYELKKLQGRLRSKNLSKTQHKRIATWGKKWRQANKGRIKRNKRKAWKKKWKRYFATTKLYNFITKLQNNKCAICFKCGKLAIDHDHKTDEFRGLICRECNAALGLVKDSPEILRRMIWYLDRGKPTPKVASHEKIEQS